jgi:pyridoxal phosphate enzyme (YggS family)
MTTLPAKLQAVRARIADAARLYGRDPAAIQLLAVSKGWPAAALRELAAAGQGAFGESYVLEAVGKIDELRDCGIEWHFIGALQANKTRLVAESFDWVHSVDELRIAQRLAAQRPATKPPICRSACRSTSVPRRAREAFRRPPCCRWRGRSQRCPDSACVA